MHSRRALPTLETQQSQTQSDDEPINPIVLSKRSTSRRGGNAYNQTPATPEIPSSANFTLSPFAAGDDNTAQQAPPPPPSEPPPQQSYVGAPFCALGEHRRAKALRPLCLDKSVDTDVPLLDHLTELLGRILRCPICIVDFVDHKSLYIKSAQGWNAPRSFDRRFSICTWCGACGTLAGASHAVSPFSGHSSLSSQRCWWWRTSPRTDGSWCACDCNDASCGWSDVNDADVNDMYMYDVYTCSVCMSACPTQAHPAVKDSPNPVCFYCGVPLVSSVGERLGTLCVLDHTPRAIDAAACSVMINVAEIVIAHLEHGLPRASLAKRSGTCVERRLLAVALCLLSLCACCRSVLAVALCVLIVAGLCVLRGSLLVPPTA